MIYWPTCIYTFISDLLAYMNLHSSLKAKFANVCTVGNHSKTFGRVGNGKEVQFLIFIPKPEREFARVLPNAKWLGVGAPRLTPHKDLFKMRNSSNTKCPKTCVFCVSKNYAPGAATLHALILLLFSVDP